MTITPEEIAELVKRLRTRAEHFLNVPRQPVQARGRFPEPTVADTLEGQAADALLAVVKERDELREQLTATIELAVEDHREHLRLRDTETVRAQAERDALKNELTEALEVVKAFSGRAHIYRAFADEQVIDAMASGAPRPVGITVGDLRRAQALIAKHGGK